MRLRQTPVRGFGRSGKRFVASCLMSLAVLLLGIADEAYLESVIVMGPESLSDGEDDVDDGDTNGIDVDATMSPCGPPTPVASSRGTPARVGILECARTAAWSSVSPTVQRSKPQSCGSDPSRQSFWRNEQKGGR
jgi:hypothetical protein